MNLVQSTLEQGYDAVATAHWAIVYHTNSTSPRARKWYHVARVIKVDGMWFELYWHPELRHGHYNKQTTRNAALAAGLALLHGVFHDVPAPRYASQLVWSLEQS